VTLSIREARAEDLEAIVRLHEGDTLGSHGDVWRADTRGLYAGAFAAIAASPDNALYVAELDGRIAGTFQLTFIPSLTSRGAVRVRVGSVQVEAASRSRGIGRQMMAFAEEAARARGAAVLELSSNKSRHDAHRFYESLGFARSHEGFKKKL